jgi:hypothetical protein
LEADFHHEYQVEDLAHELTRRTWRWFTVRIAGLSAESNWSYALWPVDPDTGERKRRPVATLIDDPDAVDAFFAREGRS